MRKDLTGIQQHMNSEIWTRSSNYREVYFKHNKGIFYKWYLCAYCRKRFLEKDIVEVDHCIAVNAVKNKWYYQLLFLCLGTTVNDSINLVASCRKCNRTKGKKTGKWVIQGAAGKIIHIVLQYLSQRFIDSLSRFWYVYLILVFGILVELASMLV